MADEAMTTAGQRSDVAARAADLVERLGSPDAEVRRDAVWRSGALIRRFRGPYGGLIEALGPRLRDREPAVRCAVAEVVEHMYRVAAPAADDLAERVAIDVDLWNVAEPVDGRDELQQIALALARLGDPRAIPPLAANVDCHPRLAIPVPHALRYFRDHSARFVPGLRRRVARGARTLPAGYADALLGVVALRWIGGVEGMPEVLNLLHAATRRQKWTLVRESLRALAEFGTAGAVSDVRAYLTSSQPQIAVHAAHVMSASPQRADCVLPVILPRLDSHRPAERDTAHAALRRLGPAAWQAAPRLRHLFEAQRELLNNGPEDWGNDGRAARTWQEIVDCAITLCHITGNPGDTLPALIDAWPRNPHLRANIAGCLAHPGPAAALALPALRDEVAAPARHIITDGLTNVVDRDETLLDRCHAIIAALAPG
jgi:hypothetical protein